MKTNKNTNKTMSALQFMKEFENTQLIMESIADATAVERKALLESEFSGQNYTNDDGVFDMNSLLDVEVSDKPENQPRYYNSPMDELNDSDKALIVDAFAKKLEEMKDDVIDFSDIGPIATVIKNTYGYKQDVEKFLQDTIQKTSNWMTQQNNTEANANGVGENNDGGPTDIKPETSGVDGSDMGVDGIPPMEEVPELTDTVASADDIVPPSPELDTDVPMGDEGIEDELVEDTEDPMGDEGIEGELSEDTEDPMGDEGIEGELSEDTEDPMGDEGDVVEDIETPAGDEDDESKEETEDDDDDTDELLESIMSEYQKSTSAKNTDQLLESIISEYQKSTSAKESVHAINESVKHNNEVKAQLEAISNEYHNKENAKVEAIKQERRVKAQLESIAGNYKAKVKAKLEAVQKEKEIDHKLNQLLESHKQKTSNDGKANLTARLEAKEKIEKLTK